jgi:phosphoribosylformylglycinamidine synthase subunit PurL
MLRLEEITVDLTQQEREAIRKRLGREPNPTELGMIDVMWSEHCSYKSSKSLLKLLPQTGPQVLVGPGYDAGVVDIGDGFAAAFKLESHNHPSAIEPYNGSATGIGGIIRDILSMGCRPVALLDALRFGPLTEGHNTWLFRNVVKGIADYGNRIGVPTVGGEIEFDESFDTNCLVNVACLGFAKKSDIIIPRFKEGNLVLLVGGSTGRDGIHGVTFASRNISEESEADRPAVQVADAFTKKLVIEAVLDALKTGHVRGVKDLGGGGLTCAASELVHKVGKGIALNMDQVHTREKGMTPAEILLSESQERMLLVVDHEGSELVRNICKKYEVTCSIIGEVTATGRFEATIQGKKVVDLPTEILTEAPLANRTAVKPAYLQELESSNLPPPYPDLSEALERTISSPNIASKEYVFRQYDHEVGVRTVVKPGEGDAAVLRLLESNRAVAISSDCNSLHCYVDPLNGAAGAVAQGAQNVVAVGAKPLAIADGCNFGNPEKPEVYWQFAKAIEGMSKMLAGLELPCIGGNVSFYNEDEQTQRTVNPTPIIVTLGLIEQLEWITTLALKDQGEAIISIGLTYPELGGSEYGSQVLETLTGRSPAADPEQVAASLSTMQSTIRAGLVTAAHDCSKGGVAVALSLMSLKGKLGAEVDLEKIPSHDITRNDELLFSESYGRFLVTASKTNAERILKIARENHAPAQIIGTTVKDSVTFKKGNLTIAESPTQKLEKLWTESIPHMMGV